MFLQTQLFELFTHLFPIHLLKFSLAFVFFIFATLSLQLYADITYIFGRVEESCFKLFGRKQIL